MNPITSVRSVKSILAFFVIASLFIFSACKSGKQTGNTDEALAVPVSIAFNADSAYAFCQAQCDFGPRTMNSEAHDQCGVWIAKQFERMGCAVLTQPATLKGYDGTNLRATNIIAAHSPELSKRIMLCAHWDSRPWADNDPDEANHKTPVMAANDGASGVAVMLEVARLLNGADSLAVGVDFVCFDAEDWGTPQWETSYSDADTWALGAQHWSMQPLFASTYRPAYGILLDMVGGQGARFHKEGMSQRFAPNIVSKVWAAAKVAGFGSFFPISEGLKITDDHIPVNKNLNLPTIDIIPYYPECQTSSFGPTWHTVNDDMAHIDKQTLQAVGQTLIQLIFTEKP